jgi:hypothetical protein
MNRCDELPEWRRSLVNARIRAISACESFCFVCFKLQPVCMADIRRDAAIGDRQARWIENESRVAIRRKMAARRHERWPRGGKRDGRAAARASSS